jgi:glycerate kinase
VPGAQLVLKTLDFEHIVNGAALVFTAEGQLDSQTAYGKAVGAVATVARNAGARVVALAGSVTADDAALAALGIDAALSIVSGPMALEDSMAHTAQLLADAAARATRLIALGQGLG